MSTEVRQNYYEILEISENATQHEIYQAYERAKKTYSAENKALHSVFTTEEAFQLRTLIDEAYEVLSNNIYRNIYEKRLMANTFSEQDLSASSIKSASEQLFERVTPPVLSENIEFIQSAALPEKNEALEKEMAEKKEWLGSDIQKYREYKNLSFDELTDITKINPWYIAAIEEMAPKKLPAAVFVRGYVLQIAKALGLNEKVVADSYMQVYRKKIEN